MRYIYKAKDLNGNWVHGAYFKFLPYTPVPIRECEPPESDYKHLIIKEGFSDWNLPRDLKVIEINPETLCQCTGMKDKNNINIFENDIIKVQKHNLCKNEYLKVFWHEEYAQFLCLNKEEICIDLTDAYKVEVVGNIFDTPEIFN